MATQLGLSLSQELCGGHTFSEDFDWLIQCGESNAYYGFGAAELLNSNSTALDLVNILGKSIEPVIISCGMVGWYRCAEDKKMESEQIERLFNEIKKYKDGIHKQG